MRHLCVLACGLAFATASFAQATADAAACAGSGGTIEQLIAACTRAIASEQLAKEDLATVFYYRGARWADKREYDRAMADFDEAIQLDPRHVAAFIDRGVVWSGAGEYDLAIEDFSEAIRLNPEIPLAYNNRGIAWSGKGAYGRAIADFGNAIQLNPQYAAAYRNRGMAWGGMHETDRAIADFTEAIRIEPGNAGSYNLFAWQLAVSRNARLRDGKRAVELATRACELTSWRNAHYLDTLAAAYAEAGQFAEAVRWQRKALEFPEFASAGGDRARERLRLYRSGKPFRE